ncbi:MAG: glycosyltransferase [Candidatus Omnitrophota bacterium]
MKICVVSPDLSNNCLGRGYFLARVLMKRYEVVITGPVFGKKIWEPVSGDASVTYRPVPFQGFLLPFLNFGKLLREIDGDVIYACKPLLTSLGAALLKNIFLKKPLVLDIEDWQTGLYKDALRGLPLPARIAYFVYSLVFFYRTNSYFNSWAGERLARYAASITVSNEFLRNKFGGPVIVHARDTDSFDPARFDGAAVRQALGLSPEAKIVMFFGTPRAHKGLDDLIKAVGMVKDGRVLLVVVGATGHRYCKKTGDLGRKTLGERYREFGLQPFHKVPEFLSAADMVAIPQKKNDATAGQIPAKLFDAMSMAKPVIATDVSDIKDILGGCGLIAEPGNPARLAEAIRHILDNPREAAEMGRKARERCIEKYSFPAA